MPENHRDNEHRQRSDRRERDDRYASRDDLNDCLRLREFEEFKRNYDRQIAKFVSLDRYITFERAVLGIMVLILGGVVGALLKLVLKN